MSVLNCFLVLFHLFSCLILSVLSTILVILENQYLALLIFSVMITILLDFCSSAYFLILLKVCGGELSARTAWLTWVECHPVHQEFVCSISSRGTSLGCRFSPWLGCVWEAADQCISCIDLSLCLSLTSFSSPTFLPLPSSLSGIN